MAVFEQYPVASWKVGKTGVELAFPVVSIQESGGNRIVERNRPYRDGAKLDDVGAQAIQWTVEAIFENTLDEEGLDQTTPLYPDILNEIVDSFRIHATGDLTLPTRGKVRARAATYMRMESDTERDYAKLSLTFVEDNEDNVDAQTFQAPTVNARMRRITETAEFDAQSEGMWGSNLQDLREFGSELEGLANAPGDALDDIDTQASIVVGTANSVGRTFNSPRGSEKLKDPELSRTQRKLEQTKDIAARSKAEAGAGRPSLVAFVVRAGTDLFTIAAQLGQDAASLIDVNPGINVQFIPKGSVINVFDEA